jgi:hypothetical protein
MVTYARIASIEMPDMRDLEDFWEEPHSHFLTQVGRALADGAGLHHTPYDGHRMSYVVWIVWGSYGAHTVGKSP